MSSNSPRVLVTGAAGFIGFFLSRRLLREGYQVVGLDNISDYYSPQLKRDRLKVAVEEGLEFHEGDMNDASLLEQLFKGGFERVVHLAAQAGVRYSLTHPHVYVESNLSGFLHILEACRHYQVKHLLYASSSSVYGANTEMPFAVDHHADHPISLYGATKRANELMAHSYAANFDLPTTGLRFFTVYGPWGRPDMALYIFARAILNNEPIKVFNHGKMRRDFTYVEDIVESLTRLLRRDPPQGHEGITSYSGRARLKAPAEVFNIGSHSPVDLSRFIALIEENLGREAEKIMLPMQLGDVEATFADVSPLERAVGYRPKTSIEDGIKNSMDWFKDYVSANPELVC